MEAQDSVPASEDWASDEEESDYDNYYYGEEDTDVDKIAAGIIIVAQTTNRWPDFILLYS